MTTAPATALDAATRDALAELLLAVADDEFVIGFWDSEWTGIAPMLEEDVATSSIAQDELGHAKALYELLAELTDDDADRIAFGRPPDAYRHAALLNHARGDWAFTVARRWLYDTADSARLAVFARSVFEPLAALATKMRREETYHLLHWEAWLERLGGGPARQRLTDALQALWPDAHAVFAPLDGERTLLDAGILAEPIEVVRVSWAGQAQHRLRALDIDLPATTPPDAQARIGRTEDFAWLHGQFTMVANQEVGATW